MRPNRACAKPLLVQLRQCLPYKRPLKDGSGEGTTFLHKIERKAFGCAYYRGSLGTALVQMVVFIF